MHKLCNLPDSIPLDFQLKHLLMGVKRELGTAEAPVDTVTPSRLLKIRSLLDCSSVADFAFWCACLIVYYGLLRLGNVAFTGAFDPSIHVRRIDLILWSWGYLLCLGIKRQFNFEKVSWMLYCHKLMAICAQLKPFRYTFISQEERIYLDHYFLQEQHLLLHCTYSFFRQKLHSILARAGIDNSNIKGHSFSRGGST